MYPRRIAEDGLKIMIKTRMALLVAFVAAAAGWFVLEARGVRLGELSPGYTLARFFGVTCCIAAAYELFVLLFAGVVRRRKGSPTEVTMLGGLLRFAAILLIVIFLLHYLGKLSGSWAAVAAFGGLLMGWSLQAPVSGVAAWVLINVKRPFRLGDRVQLPTFGLIGDVKQVGMMYTVLNQVGGTVGSEEAAGRNILIPNAMLFANIVINYTPEHTAAFVLDEVVVRITYDSDWDLAEKILLIAANEVTGDIIQETGQKPYIRSDLYDYGVYMRLRFTTLAMDRPRIVHEITKRVFHEFQATPRVDFAIPFVYSYRMGMKGGGKGLNAGAGEPDVLELPLEQVDDPQGTGESAEASGRVLEMSRKIAELGLLQPIIVQRKSNGRYAIVAGHLRLAACRKLGWKTIPGIVREPMALEISGAELPPVATLAQPRTPASAAAIHVAARP